MRGDRSLVLRYGETEKSNKQTPDGNSLLRLNSITKVFTTEVLAQPARHVVAGAVKPAAAVRRLGVDARAVTAEAGADHQPGALLGGWREAGVRHAQWRRDKPAKQFRIGAPCRCFD